MICYYSYLKDWWYRVIFSKGGIGFGEDPIRTHKLPTGLLINILLFLIVINFIDGFSSRKDLLVNHNKTNYSKGWVSRNITTIIKERIKVIHISQLNKERSYHILLQHIMPEYKDSRTWGNIYLTNSKPNTHRILWLKCRSVFASPIIKNT